jgi:hypothetical protein
VGLALDLKKLGELIGQWHGLIAAIAALLAAGVGLWKQVLQLDPFAWPWRELLFILVAGSVVTVIAIRSRNMRASTCQM